MIINKIKCRYRSQSKFSFIQNCAFCKKKELCNSGSKSIFIVDDDINILAETEEYFANIGYDCYVFNSASEAIVSLTIFKCDIIISDYHMDPLDGLLLVNYVKKHNLSNLIILNSGVFNLHLHYLKGIHFFIKPIFLPNIIKLINSTFT